METLDVLGLTDLSEEDDFDVDIDDDDDNDDDEVVDINVCGAGDVDDATMEARLRDTIKRCRKSILLDLVRPSQLIQPFASGCLLMVPKAILLDIERLSCFYYL